MPGGARWGVLFASRWVSVERLFVLLSYVSGRDGVAGDAGGVMFRLLEHLFSLPTGGDSPPSPYKLLFPRL
jgi:hypothetical protein